MYLDRDPESIRYFDEQLPDHDIRVLLRPSHDFGRFLFNTRLSGSETTAKVIGMIMVTDYGLFNTGSDDDIVRQYFRIEPALPSLLRFIDCQGVALLPDGGGTSQRSFITDITDILELAPTPIRSIA